MVPPHIVKTPAICEPVKPHEPSRVGSDGIARVEEGLSRWQPEIKLHGSALVTVRFHVVK